MKSITIKGTKRESVGKLATKALRNAEKVPCVLYGGGEEPIHFSANENSFTKLVYTPNVYTVVIELDEGEVKKSTILQDIQFHPVSDKILHVDFYELHDDKEVIMEIPTRLIGTSPGVLMGGSLRHNMRTLKIRAFPSKLPDYIEVDISKLEIGSKLYVTEVYNDSYTILNPENTVICQVKTSRNVASADKETTDEEKTSEETTETKK